MRSPTGKGASQFGVSVADASPGDAWAVADDVTNLTKGDTVAAFHFNGTTWTRVPVPSLGAATTQNRPSGITIASPTDVWISATEQPVPGPLRTPYLLHYNGTKFIPVAVPSPGGPEFDFNDTGTALNGITSLGPSDIYVVGVATYNGAASLGFVRHYNGTSWSTLAVPQPGDAGALGQVPSSYLLAAAAAPGPARPGTGAVFLAGAQGTPLQLFGTAPLALVSTSG